MLFISATATLILLPLLAVIGSPVLWGLLPFLLGVLVAIWYFISRSYKDGEILEELRLWDDHITLSHHHPRAGTQTWQANPYWVRLEMLPESGPVENYLILKGGERDVEIGAFLSPEERTNLQQELNAALRQATP